jgi:outer membrane protein assembly factor BamA
VGVYNIFDEILFRDPQPELDDYYRYRERQTGLYLLYRYPFTRFFRAELTNMLYQRGQSWSDWIWNSDNETGNWGPEYDKHKEIVYTPALTLVHDNSLYGSTGPLLGWRALYTVSTTLADSKMEYVTNYLDWRSYTLFSKRYSLAARAIAGISLGESPERFDLAGYYGVRAYGGNLTGEKKALVSAELRFPFFEYINLAFPIPLSIPNIRGSLFADLGTVFDEFESFRGANDGKLNDLYMGYGFGPRLDMGYVILRFDITWLTDLTQSSKPSYYLSLSEDF